MNKRYTQSGRGYSENLDRFADPHTRGMPTYDPQQLFQYIFDNVDRDMIVLYSQAELADAIGINRETMQYWFSDMMDMGWMERAGRRGNTNQFRVLCSPDDVEWDDEVYRKLSVLRKWHQTAYRKKYKEQGITKGEMLNG